MQSLDSVTMEVFPVEPWQSGRASEFVIQLFCSGQNWAGTPEGRPGARRMDFEPIREPWNRYRVSDGAALKIRTVVTGVERLAKGGEYELRISAAALVVVAGGGGRAADQKSETAYQAASQEPNEYVLDDGTRIRILPGVEGIYKSGSAYTVKAFPRPEIRPGAR